MMILD